ncbi:hypothetical protein PIB30_113571, partial [Stylosanthes scabra]|nr:hypothetical protein [Stylosanthes scabra]
MGTQGETSITCGLCGGPHENHNCCLIRENQLLEQANYMGNQQRQPYQDPNANTYKPDGGITLTLVGEGTKIKEEATFKT